MSTKHTTEMEAIADLVPAGARVLDLGCGDGALLAHLQQAKGCTGYGVEIDDANVLACSQRGINVLQLNLEEGLALFDDQSFDVVLQKHLKVMDAAAIALARDNGLPIIVFSLDEPNGLAGVVQGRGRFTIVEPG